jgi:hypothetical protein
MRLVPSETSIYTVVTPQAEHVCHAKHEVARIVNAYRDTHGEDAAASDVLIEYRTEPGGPADQIPVEEFLQAAT